MRECGATSWLQQLLRDSTARACPRVRPAHAQRPRGMQQSLATLTQVPRLNISLCTPRRPVGSTIQCSCTCGRLPRPVWQPRSLGSRGRMGICLACSGPADSIHSGDTPASVLCPGRDTTKQERPCTYGHDGSTSTFGPRSTLSRDSSCFGNVAESSEANSGERLQQQSSSREAHRGARSQQQPLTPSHCSPPYGGNYLMYHESKLLFVWHGSC